MSWQLVDPYRTQSGKKRYLVDLRMAGEGACRPQALIGFMMTALAANRPSGVAGVTPCRPQGGRGRARSIRDGSRNRPRRSTNKSL